MFPERFTAIHEAFQAGAEDSQGNPVDGWDAPVERRFVTVFPVDQDELIRAEQSGMKWHLDMLCLTVWAGPKDKVTVGGEPYTVVGEVDDFTHHPWGFPGGYRIRLRAVRG